MRDPRRQHLSQGMVIDAAIEARLLGFRLLTLNANVTVLPAVEAARRRGGTRPIPATALPTTTQPRPGSTNGEISGALAEAAHSLAASAADLEAARNQMAFVRPRR